MVYTEERFKTRLERNQRCEELKKTHSGVVIWSNPVKTGEDAATLKSIYETEWIVGYPEQVIETEEQLVQHFYPNEEVHIYEGTTEQEHQAADGLSKVLPSAS